MAGPSAHEEHLSRIAKGFRYEERIMEYENAVKYATERSLKTNKKIYLAEYDKEGEGYVVNSHGVELIGEKVIAVFHKGVVLREQKRD